MAGSVRSLVLNLFIPIRKTSVFTLFLFTTVTAVVFGQDEIIKVTPLSPNAASIARYGETPVGHFTGVPSISIPIHIIQSGELSLPLSLSYHAGGIKVEDVASSVGLGWSLSGPPTISRRIMNLPDEGSNGFYERYQGQPIIDYWTADEIAAGPISLGQNTINQGAPIWSQLVKEGLIDLEPDIFNYNLLNASGVFFYNQDTESFNKRPMNQIQIIRHTGNTYILIDEKGVKYFFDQIESTGQNSLELASTWYVSKIVNANHTDSLVFEYNFNLYSTRKMNSETVHLGGPPAPSSPISTINVTGELVVDRITYRDGYVQFNYSTTQREDLPGTYALSNVQVFDKNSSLLKKVGLSYSYWLSNAGGWRCSVAEIHEKKRMLLDEVKMYGNDDNNPQRYTFEYNKPSDVPCRLSASQDYWGFSNGKDANNTLIPTQLVQSSMYIGADRSVDPVRSQMGVLQKMTYPTGGYTEYVYENNQASYSVGSLPSNYVTDGVSIGDWEPEFLENLPIYFQAVSDSFTIQNGSDAILNGVSEGGVFVNVSAGGFGCELNGLANICADVKLRGTNGFQKYIFGDEQFYIPNGTYYLEASFNQDPANYGGFYAVVTYKKIQSVDGGTVRYAGGLRVKTIKHYDQNSLIKTSRFRYTNGINSNASSGQVFGSTLMNFRTDMPLGYRLESQPAMQMITESGSYIGYHVVIEETISSESNGYAQYEFTNAHDEGSFLFPYPPEISYKFMRGQPLKTSFFKKVDTVYHLVKDVSYQYKDVMLNHLGKALKLAYYYPRGTPGTIFKAVIYDLQSGWSKVSKQTERTFDATGTNYVAVETLFEYDDDHLQLSKSMQPDNFGDTTFTRYYYPQDLTLTGDAENARQELVARNNISAIMKTEISKGTRHLQTSSTDYNQVTIGSNTQVLPSLYAIQNQSDPKETRVEFLKYDAGGRILEQRLSDNLIHAYIWDEVHGLLLAEVTNATSDNIYHSSFEVSGTSETVSNPAHTGTRYLNTGSYNFSSNGFIPASTTNLKMSYWYWSSSKWNFSGIVNWNNTISAGTRLDEIRVFPAEAQMITYTHAPGIGITSQTDANNVTTYYEYDSFGRLKWLRDKDKNIVKKIDYHYRKTN